ncbi:MAG: serine/threonine protein kinase [Pseudomonadota bacterium]
MASQDPSKNDKSSGESGEQAARGDGPGKIGLISAEQPGLVSPSGVNERDHGSADDKPMGGGSLNFDDDDMTHPRGNVSRQGGTWEAKGGDSGKLGQPAEIQSDRIGTSDPDRNAKK